MPPAVISLSKNMSLYSYLSTSFLIHLMPLVAQFPHTVCYFTYVMTKNTMVSYLRLCHSTVTMILSGEYRATQYDLQSVTPCN